MGKEGELPGETPSFRSENFRGCNLARNCFLGYTLARSSRNPRAFLFL